MSVPPDTPVLQFIYWLINTPGLGGLAVGALVGTCLACCGAALHWIVRGGQASEVATYAYPTSALHDHEPQHHQ